MMFTHLATNLWSYRRSHLTAPEGTLSADERG